MTDSPLKNYKLAKTCASCLNGEHDFSKNTAYDTYHCKLMEEEDQKNITVDGHFVCDEHVQDGYCLE